MDARETAGGQSRTVSGAAGSLLHSLSQLGATLVDYGKSQLSQLGNGVEEEIQHTARTLLLSCLIVLLSTIALLMTAFTVVVAFWDTPYRLLAAILATVTLFVLAAVAGLIMRRHLQRPPTALRSVVRSALLFSAWRRLIR